MRVAPASIVRLDRVDRPQPSADLDRDRHLRADPPHVLDVGRLAAASAVEIDDVQGAGAVCDPPPRGVERVGVVDLLGVELSLLQAHRLAATDIDRG